MFEERLSELTKYINYLKDNYSISLSCKSFGDFVSYLFGLDETKNDIIKKINKIHKDEIDNIIVSFLKNQANSGTRFYKNCGQGYYEEYEYVGITKDNKIETLYSDGSSFNYRVKKIISPRAILNMEVHI